MKKAGLANRRTPKGLPSASDPETEADRTLRGSLLACMTANREPSNQSFEVDREATVCTASRRFLPLCGREAARTRGTSLAGRYLFGSLSALGLGCSLIPGVRWLCRRRMLRCLGLPRFTGVSSTRDRDRAVRIAAIRSSAWRLIPGDGFGATTNIPGVRAIAALTQAASIAVRARVLATSASTRALFMGEAVGAVVLVPVKATVLSAPACALGRGASGEALGFSQEFPRQRPAAC
jgi:hypothetical protein